MNDLIGTVVQMSAVNIVLIALASSVFAGGRPLTASLSGASEIPGPGDPDGSGNAQITMNQGQVCFSVTTSGVALPAISAHIHGGTPDMAGPVVIPLAPPNSEGKSEGCVSGVDDDLVKAIRQNPQYYYVNVHTAEYPAGAIRGQLTK